jgi:hypothetical protein
MALAGMRLVAAVVGIGLVLAGCDSSGPIEQFKPIKPGICVADETTDEGDLVPDLSSIVDCTTPHVYEVYDIIGLPATALSGSSRQERIENRNDLALPSELSDDSPQRQAFEEFAERECATSLQRVTGFDELTLRGTSAEDARVVPALRGVNTPWYTVMPEKEWLDGRRQVVCSARFEDPTSTGAGRTPAQAQASADFRMILTKVGGTSLSAGFRQCRAYDKKRRKVSIVSCAEQHVDETLFYFEADRVFGKKFIEGIETLPTPKKFDRFDEACASTFPQILGPDYDRKAVRGFGSVARRWTKERKTVRCSVGPKDFRRNDLPAGSLVGTGAEKIELVRVRRQP